MEIDALNRNRPPSTYSAHTQQAPWFGNLQALFERRFAGLPAWVVLIELFIGFGWLRAAVEKVIEVNWWKGDVVAEFVATHADVTLLWFAPYLERIVLENPVAIGVIVVAMQLAVGIALISRRRLGAALVAGMFLNVNFILAGAVNPSIFYIVCQGALGLWLLENRVKPETAETLLAVIGATGVATVLVTLPFISTVHPAHVIEDPAVVLAFLGLLGVVVSGVARRRMR